MDKNPLTFPEKIVSDVKIHDKIKKTKKNRKPTACMDKRKFVLNCGICGSENIVTEGVVYCTTCQEEEFFYSEKSWFWDVPTLQCKLEKWEVTHEYSHRLHTLNHCIDCGATNGPKCPVCKNGIWTNGNQKYCQHCGYRSL